MKENNSPVCWPPSSIHEQIIHVQVSKIRLSYAQALMSTRVTGVIYYMRIQ